ncbi:MAG: delta-class carbonic anhydrase [Pseudomonas sp.]
MKAKVLFILAAAIAVPFNVFAKDSNSEGSGVVSDRDIANQRANLKRNTTEKGTGPQAPRDIDSAAGSNTVSFGMAPVRTEMNLCNIHFHNNAEHKGGEFTKYAGNGDGYGYESGFKYSGNLSKSELAPLSHGVCLSKHGGLQSGDTIEVHYVYSSAQVKPGPTLGACLNDATKNPQLRVEAQVFVLVNDSAALDFAKLSAHGEIDGYQQALGLIGNTGEPIQYSGSTTGPGYNEQGSPFQVTWSVRPKVAKVNIASVGKWCEGNVFNEDHAHGVRNLVNNPKLLSKIKR